MNRNAETNWRLEGQAFHRQADYSRQAAAFQERLITLLEALGQLGTLVEYSALHEVDPDIPPYNFTRRSRRVFVFPPQPDVVLEGEESDHPGTAPYTLTEINRLALCDENLVKGRLMVDYDDATRVPHLEIQDDLNGTSQLEPEVLEAIEAAIDPWP